MIADQTKAEWDAAFRRITHSSGNPGIGHGNYNVRLCRRFASQFSAQVLAAQVDCASEDHAVGPREVHMLKDATGLRTCGRIKPGAHALWTDDDQFARFHVALVLGSDEIEGACFGRKDDGVALLESGGGNSAHGERPKTTRIAGGKNPVHADHHEGKGAFYTAKSIGHRLGESLLATQCDQVNNHVGVANDL